MRTELREKHNLAYTFCLSEEPIGKSRPSSHCSKHIRLNQRLITPNHDTYGEDVSLAAHAVRMIPVVKAFSSVICEDVQHKSAEQCHRPAGLRVHQRRAIHIYSSAIDNQKRNIPNTRAAEVGSLVLRMAEICWLLEEKPAILKLWSETITAIVIV